jgi:hypothetical protein
MEPKRPTLRDLLCYGTMPPNSVLDLLSNLSATKLQAMERLIEDQIADLRSQKELVGRALTKKGARPRTTPNGTDTKPTRRRRQGGRTGSMAVLRDIVREQPDRVWMPIEIIGEAHERGVTSQDQAIRVALRRLGEQNFLQRGPDGTGWQLAASQNGSGELFQTSPPSAQKAEGGEDVG